jgi:RimJ/RimL family protein N-acetyltransferase
MPIRPLTPADAADYSALRREMLADSPWAFAASPDEGAAVDPALFVNWISQADHRALGAFEDAPGGDRPRLVGSAFVYRLPRRKLAHRAYIEGVYVTPTARNRGLATALMRAALDQARAWPGITGVGLSVSQDSPAAQRVYERVGFKAWGREPAALSMDGRTYDEIHMVAFLSESA